MMCAEKRAVVRDPEDPFAKVHAKAAENRRRAETAGTRAVTPRVRGEELYLAVLYAQGQGK